MAMEKRLPKMPKTAMQGKSSESTMSMLSTTWGDSDEQLASVLLARSMAREAAAGETGDEGLDGNGEIGLLSRERVEIGAMFLEMGGRKAPRVESIHFILHGSYK